MHEKKPNDGDDDDSPKEDDVKCKIATAMYPFIFNDHLINRQLIIVLREDIQPINVNEQSLLGFKVIIK